jgi:plastocyanin
MRMLAIGVLGWVVVAGRSATWQRPSVPVSDTTVAIKTFLFRPTDLVIPAGTKVTWNNGDEIEHTITSGTPDSASSAFNGKLGTQGASFAHTFTRAGTFSYFCDRHHFMRGTIRVTSNGEH